MGHFCVLITTAQKEVVTALRIIHYSGMRMDIKHLSQDQTKRG